MGASALATALRLNETTRGHCPVCRENWTTDPDCHCACTRPRPGDEQAMIKAYARSAAHREAKLSADALQAGTVRSLSNVVVPINRRRRSALRR